MLATPDNLQKAADHLAAHDPLLAPVIARAGLPTLKPHTDYYAALVTSIISQQLSVKAAATIRQRFIDLCGGSLPTPEQLLVIPTEDLRSVGLSYAKARYVHDLAEHIVDGRVRFDRIAEQSNEEIISELTAVKGLGVWTVHMFLIFCVGRLDILPTGDLGVKNGIKALYGLDHVPSPEEIETLSTEKNWTPYQSVAAWYIWHSLDNQPAL